MRLALAVVALVLALLAAPLLFKPSATPDHRPVEGLPWQIEVTPEGTRVFGLTLGRSTLNEARARFGAELEVAVVAAPGEAGALEAYVANATLGAVTGRLILAADLPAEELAGVRERAAKVEYMESTTRKYRPAPADLARVMDRPIAAITLIPSVNLDKATIRQRFGTPAEQLGGGKSLQHLLYPAKGLAVTLDPEGKEVLQYVAPADFARLRDPLLAGKH